MNTSIDKDNLEFLLECPILCAPLTDAVTLIPCCHKISEAAVQIIFPSNDNRKCPICKQSIEKYYPDCSYRSLVETIQKLQIDKILLNKDFIEVPEFPGPKGEFTLESGFWRFFWGVTDLRRYMEFKSKEGGVFESFSLLGYTGGEMSLSLKIHPLKVNDFKIYLKRIGFTGEEIDSSGFLKVYDPDSIKKIYTVVSKSYKLPSENIPLLEALVKAGNWKMITPVKWAI